MAAKPVTYRLLLSFEPSVSKELSTPDCESARLSRIGRGAGHHRDPGGRPGTRLASGCAL
jgi:hypothetical protein